MSKRPYDSVRWRKLRLEILERDGYVCQIRLPGCTGQAVAVDHIEEWTRNPEMAFDAGNLRAACTPCNTRRRNKRQASRRRHVMAAEVPAVAVDHADRVGLSGEEYGQWRTAGLYPSASRQWHARDAYLDLPAPQPAPEWWPPR